jgi:hypothetical protein
MDSCTQIHPSWRMTICLYQSLLYASISLFLKRLQFQRVTQTKPDTKGEPSVFIGRSSDFRAYASGESAPFACTVIFHWFIFV